MNCTKLERALLAYELKRFGHMPDLRSILKQLDEEVDELHRALVGHALQPAPLNVVLSDINSEVRTEIAMEAADVALALVALLDRLDWSLNDAMRTKLKILFKRLDAGVYGADGSKKPEA